MKPKTLRGLIVQSAAIQDELIRRRMRLEQLKRRKADQKPVLPIRMAQ